MSPTLRKAFQNVALALVVGAAGTGAVLGWKKYGGVNPYAEIESHKRPSDPTSAFVAKGVQIRHYEKGKLVAKTDAKDITMSQDRNSLTLTGIKNGMVDSAKGPVQFEGGKGVLRPNLKMVDVSNGVRVKGQGYDFKTSQANIDGRQGKITMPQPLKGSIGGGSFIAGALEYIPNSDFMHMKRVVWQGPPPKGAEVPPGAQGRNWKIVYEDSVQKGFLSTYTDARAEDGEIIVMAPKVVRDAKTDVVTATGRATYRSAKADIIADKVVVFRKEKKAIFTGNVIMLVRPKKDWDKPLPKNDAGAAPLSPTLPAGLEKKGSLPETISPAEKKRDEELRSGKTIRDYPTNLKAAEVTYWYGDGNRHAVAKGGEPTAYQRFDDGRWRVMNAFEAHYDGEKDVMELFSDGTKRQVKMKNSIGDTYDAVWLQMTTKEDMPEEDEEIKSKSAIVNYVDRDAENDPRGAAKPADPKKPPTTAPPAKTEPPVKTGP